MNRLKRWKDNINLNFKEHTLITLLLIAMYAAFIKTIIDLLGKGVIIYVREQQ